MDAATHRILHFSFIYRKERIEDYLAGIAYLKGQGIQVNGVISDGLSGLKKALEPILYQYCQFHQVQRIRQLLTNHPKHPASITLKEISLQVTHSDKSSSQRCYRNGISSGGHTWRRKHTRKMGCLSFIPIGV